jgi:hypothetical protein
VQASCLHAFFSNGPQGNEVISQSDGELDNNHPAKRIGMANEHPDRIAPKTCQAPHMWKNDLNNCKQSENFLLKYRIYIGEPATLKSVEKIEARPGSSSGGFFVFHAIFPGATFMTGKVP